eukprot:g17903.t1
MAAYHGQKWAVDTLLRLGADRLAANDKGQIPFQVARHNNIRSMLKPAVAPGETVVVFPGDVGAERGVGRPKENDSGNTTALLHKSSIHQKQNSPSGKVIDNVPGGIDHRCFGRKGAGPFTSGEPSDADAGRQGEELSSKRHHDNVEPSTNDRSDGGPADYRGEGFDRLVNGSLVSGLESTDALKEESYYFLEQSVGDLSFEEGSSEGAPSLESEAAMR